MEAKELRIGNFVYYNGSHQEIGKVSGVIDDLVTEPKVFIGFRIDIPYQLSSLKPIPLTEEWLLNFKWNGYKALHFNSNFEIDKQGRLYCNGDYKGLNVIYVHQLQNLYFALTGMELVLMT